MFWLLHISSCVLEIIIQGDLLNTLFFILVCIFLIFDTHWKKWDWCTNIKNGYGARFLSIIVHLLGCIQKLEWSCKTSFLRAHNINQNIWVPTSPHQYYLARPRAKFLMEWSSQWTKMWPRLLPFLECEINVPYFPWNGQYHVPSYPLDLLCWTTISHCSHNVDLSINPLN
jgi:hypothetical protein